MKTKQILTALALPVMFAACTADDIEGLNNGLQQDGRAKLSKNFVLNTVSEAESRYAVEGSSKLDMDFEEGDLIGANIIDQYNPDKKDKPEEWNILYYVAPALPFKNVGDDQWKSDQELGVGNYLFTYPYNAKDNNRAAAVYELPVVQDLTDGDLNAVIATSNKAVGATVVYEGETSKDVDMKNLFTYPKFIVKFAVGQSLKKVNKVALEGDFVVKAGYNHKKVAALFAEDYAKFAAEAGTTRANVLWETKGATYNKEKHSLNWDLVATEDFIISSTDVAARYNEAKAFGEPKTAKFIVAEINQDVLTDADGNKYVEARFMMPSMVNFLNEGLKLYAYADNGVYSVSLTASNMEFKSTTTSTAKANALLRSRTNTLTVAPITSKPSSDENNVVTTIEDWNNLVSLYGDDKEKVGDDAINVAVVGSSFVLNETTEMPEEAEFKVSTPIEIEGVVAIKNLTVSEDITVKKGAVLTIDETLDAQNIINKGTLNIVEEANIKGIENVGTLNVNKYGKLLEEKVASRTEEVDNSVKVVNKGTMNVAEGGDVKADVENLGALNISGYVNSKLVNGALGADKEDNELAVITMSASEKAILKGTVTNHKYSKVVSAKDASVKVSDNKGEVEFVDGAKVEVTGGTISYKTAETSFSNYYFVNADNEKTAKYYVNKLILTKDASFAGTSTGKAVDFSGKTIVLSDGVDITITKGHKLTVGTLEVEGKSEIAKTGEIVVTTLNVLEGGDLITNAPITVSSVDVEKKGYITVGAKLTADKFNNDGSVTNNSTVVVREGELTGKGSWTGDKVSNGTSYAQEDYEEALYNYVELWSKHYALAATVSDWDDIVDAIIADSPVQYSMEEVAKELLAAYNGYKLGEDDEELELTKPNMKTILEAAAEEDVEELQDAIAALKTASITSVKTVLTAKVAETDDNGELVFTTAWKNNAGYATLGGEKKNETLGLKDMWTAYVTYLTGNNGIKTWIVEDEDGNDTTPYKSAYDNLIETYRLAINSIVEAAHMDGSYTDADGETVEVVPSNPDLAIPAGSYIDASSKTGAEYVVVNAWVHYVAPATSLTGMSAVDTYTLADLSAVVAPTANDNYLNYIQNWCFEFNKVKDSDLTVENYKIKTAIKDHVSTVVNNWKAPKYSQENLHALVGLLAN